MPYLICLRHGNTFETGQTPTYVGGRTDIPLTQEGVKQGERAALMIKDHYMPLDAILSGPLQRTQRFADLVSTQTGVAASIDQRLCEIDYGLWENKTTEEVKTLYGEQIIQEWEEKGVWPEAMNWSPSLNDIQQNSAGLLAEQHAKLAEQHAANRVIITSNGILRFFYQLITGQHPSKEAKVKTGHYCVLEPAGETWRIIAWNEKPPLT